jgi:hypothetical protein
MEKQEQGVDSRFVEPFGWGISDWCKRAGFSRCTFYRLPFKPVTVKLRHKRLVLEHPKDYLARIATQQGASV